VARLLIILDLDETLVHVSEHPLAWNPHFTVRGFAGYRRPHLDAFLDELRGRYDVAVWTTSEQDYADAVLAEIIPWRAELTFVWSRNTIKRIQDVEACGHDPGRALFVDDSPEKYLHDYDNLIHVEPFLGDPSDDELPAVARYIHSLEDEPNVRAIEKRYWRSGNR
jgi:RNA polymerase II subunit A small phosphatase-like protein